MCIWWQVLPLLQTPLHPVRQSWIEYQRTSCSLHWSSIPVWCSKSHSLLWMFTFRRDHRKYIYGECDKFLYHLYEKHAYWFPHSLLSFDLMGLKRLARDWCWPCRHIWVGVKKLNIWMGVTMEDQWQDINQGRKKKKHLKTLFQALIMMIWVV